MEAKSPSQDASAALCALSARAPRLELSTLDICFLAALQLHAQTSAVSAFTEERLFDWFEEVALLTEPGALHLRRRATHAIGRLRDQRLLARVDGAGVRRSGEYALTRLGVSIVEFFMEEEALTTESLTLITRALHSSLLEVLATARKAASAEQLAQAVVGPLEVTVHDLMAGIERRQRGLDAQQEKFQKEIATLLSADWFGALSRCQELLEQSGNTLHELNELLLGETQRLHVLLDDLEELAAQAGSEPAERALRAAAEQVDRIAAWSSTRQKAWSDYYQYVHRFLRDVVRLDPARALTQRLREQLGGKRGRAFALTVARTSAPLLLRELSTMPDRPPVKRPRVEREKPPSDVEPEDRLAMLERQVHQVISEGAAGLGEVTTRVTCELAEPERFVTAGRVAQIVGELRRTTAERERPWTLVDEALEIEDWTLREEASS